MGILIKGMDEIPEDGAVLVVKHDNGKAYIKHACTYGYSMELVKLPAVQPERKKGRWLRYGEDGYPNNEDTVFWQCDQCLEQYTGRTKRIPNFCPNCGADMRGEQDE